MTRSLQSDRSDRSHEHRPKGPIYYLSYSVVPSRDANAIQVMKMCEALARRSPRVVLFCRSTRRPHPDVHAYYGVRRSFAVRTLYLPRVPVLSRVTHSLVTLARLGFAAEPSLFYARDAYLLALLALLPAHEAPLILEAHQPPSNRLEAFLQRRIFRSRHFAGLVVISRALRTRYEAQFGPLLQDRIMVAPDGADPPPLGGDGATSPDRSTSGRFTLGYVGSLSPGKGMELIAQLAPLLPSCEFHVLGGAPAEVAAWRERLSAENVVFHGFARPGAVPGHLERFDAMLAPYQLRVCVGPKRRDVAPWMSPLKIFEYMAAGKPIVASDLPVIREVLRDGVNALLAPPGDPAAWATRIETLKKDPMLADRLADNARQDLLRAFTWRARTDAILAALPTG